ncbi:hypothetical protein SEVIR_5G323100v4 [Setaria viridis]|uniref:Uncharacterized protein n=2 Tax=Setaria TaxID=4554 RepID=K3XN46_SETIT|nr:uncharacterized protein LOC101777048 [Setaria italica]XP_034597240.1 uncharacterized protein LOC117858302 [Setaria viridis]TKW16793.1 hypothetical protein SEVIR_5G323100v2 [Setaria viridis]
MGVSTTDLSAPTRSVNLSGCMATASSSTSSSSTTTWPRADKHRGAAAVVRRAQLVLSRDAGWCGLRAWRRLIRRLAQETKCICSSPTAATGRPITFGYDAASYAKNFDDGRSPAPRCAAPVIVVASAVDDSRGS